MRACDRWYKWQHVGRPLGTHANHRCAWGWARDRRGHWACRGEICRYLAWAWRGAKRWRDRRHVACARQWRRWRVGIRGRARARSGGQPARRFWDDGVYFCGRGTSLRHVRRYFLRGWKRKMKTNEQGAQCGRAARHRCQLTRASALLRTLRRRCSQQYGPCRAPSRDWIRHQSAPFARRAPRWLAT